MEFKIIKPVFGALAMLGTAIFASNAAVADAVVVSKEDGKAHTHIAKIMDKNDAQIALAINKDLSLNVLGVRAGKHVEPCEKEKDNHCHFDQDKVFSEKTLTVTVIEGSCCTYISTGSATYEFCPPQWPQEFISSISGESCPRDE